MFMYSSLGRRERAACMQAKVEGPNLPRCLITASMHSIAVTLRRGEHWGGNRDIVIFAHHKYLALSKSKCEVVL